MHVMGRAEARLRPPPYGSNPKMPPHVMQELFYKCDPPLPESQWRGTLTLNRPTPIPQDRWDWAFAPEPVAEDACRACEGRGRRWTRKREKGIAQRLVVCDACRGSGKDTRS